MAPQPHPNKLVSRTIVPMFRKPDPLAEQVSQATLGMEVAELEPAGIWSRIRTPDGYEGWAAAEALVEAPLGWGSPWAEVLELWINLRAEPHFHRAAVTQATVGTRLPALEQVEGFAQLLLPDGRRLWTEAHRVRSVKPGSHWPRTRAGICRTARRFLGTPYLWGGSSPLGLDCSGFVQLVLRLHGIFLERDAGPQSRQGSAADPPDAADLVFFAPDRDAGRISHVGMMLDRRRFIHAKGSACVRIDLLEDPEFSRVYVGARTYL